MSESGRIAAQYADAGWQALRWPDPPAGLRQFGRAVALDPNAPSPWFGLAIALDRLGRRPLARNSLAVALDLGPEQLRPKLIAGDWLAAGGRTLDAIGFYRQAAALMPGEAALAGQMGILAAQAGEDDMALPLLRAAATTQPNLAPLQQAMAAVLRRTGQPAAAARAIARTLSLAPGAGGAWHNVGNLLLETGDLDGAARAQDRAVALDPRNGEHRWARALLALLRREPGATGRHEERLGRLFYERHGEARSLPAWNGGPLEGGRLLIEAEQGQGDTIQMLRYLPLLPGDGSRILRVQPALGRFCRALGLADEVADLEAAMPAADRHVMTMSLAHALGGDLTDPPPPPPIPDRWAPPAKGERLRIGFCWRGNKDNPQDRLRSLPLTALLAALKTTGAALVSLQKDGSVDLAEADPDGTVTDLGAELGDFLDTADRLRQVDLIVSVDTALAHLAGTLGWPVRLLLHDPPDWRWGLAGETTPLYPAMRLYRQESPGDWSEPLKRISAIR